MDSHNFSRHVPTKHSKVSSISCVVATLHKELAEIEHKELNIQPLDCQLLALNRRRTTNISNFRAGLGNSSFNGLCLLSAIYSRGHLGSHQCCEVG